MNKLIITMSLCVLLAGCGDDPFADNSPIKDTDYAQIRLEIERCSHLSEEGSWSATMRWSPRNDCLKHLKTRIVDTGNQKKVLGEI